MPDYHNLPALLDDSIVQRASEFGSALLADGMSGLGYPNDGCLDASILPVDINSKMVGTALTVETLDGDNFPIHVAIYQGKPGYVLVIDGKDCKDRAYLGDLIGSTAKAIGVEGIVVDGLVRDRLGLEDLGLPVYSRGYQQRGPLKIGPGKINISIQCAGVTVNPGDLVVGDADGVTVVPREAITKVLEKATAKKLYEEARRKTFDEYDRCKREGLPLPELAPKWVLDMLNQQ